MTHQLGYGKNKTAPPGQSNRRNGTTAKKVKSAVGEFAIEVPRDRAGEYEPVIIEKHQRRFDGFDDNIMRVVFHADSRRGTFRHIWRRFTELRYRPI